jgi:3-mercaptopyruvate sulfurtransferase SseA
LSKDRRYTAYKMKKIYICSPLRGDYEQNIENAILYCREVIREGHIPIAPHLYFTQFLDDTIPSEREIGLKYGLELVKSCDKVYVYGEPSEGMQAEIELAEQLGIEVVYRC